MAKGGMCKNPFGGFPRLDKMEPKDFMRPNDPPEKALLLSVTLDALHNYLYFGLGNQGPDGRPRGNGTTASEFYMNHEWFFKIRSYQPETWEHARVMRDTYVDATGKRRTVYRELTDRELKLMCFDTQFDMVNWPCTLNQFLSWMKWRREQVLNGNKEQIREYLELLREDALLFLKPGQPMPIAFGESREDMRILISPRSPEEVAQLVGYLPKHRRRVRYAVTVKCPSAFKPEVLEASEKVALTLKELKGPIFDSVEASVPGTALHAGDCGAGLSA